MSQDGESESSVVQVVVPVADALFSETLVVFMFVLALDLVVVDTGSTVINAACQAASASFFSVVADAGPDQR